MIIFEDVSLYYGEKIILDGLSFEARFYEKIAILGKSGAGKTTILKLILGLSRPDRGRILIDGVDITTLKESQLREFRMKFSIVFQEGALFDSLNVRENVAFCLREYTNLTEDEIQKRVVELLKRVGVEEAVDLMPEQLSGGMQRRVAIARSLAACEPLMFLYDEPTTGLDPITADSICTLMNELSSGQPPDRKGLIVVTHKVTDAVKVAERFLYLSNGRLSFDGDLEQLKNTEDQELRHFIYDILQG
ncbi:MAG: ATP-binding cassette domain-containing protein [Nitrospirae bacterium]|nr:ATP-binding cassette domain-containing protein [Nitrospirota bacterium]